MKTRTNDSNWASFSDIMTGLMVVFMFIAISYMNEVQKEKQARDAIFKEFRETQKLLSIELNNEFGKDFTTWQIELDNDLSIKFTNPDVLFESGKVDIRPQFSNILKQFLPRYFEIILQPKYNGKIAEIRIEGHTDAIPAPQYDRDAYIGNIKLSQLRSAEVLKFFRGTHYFQTLNEKDKRNLQFLITANGLSYGRTLDSNKQLTVLSGKRANNKFSRRVEFRIITSSDVVIKKVLEQMEK